MNVMRRSAGFTLIEMIVSVALFAAGSIYVYATFAGVTQSTASATMSIDLGSQNKRVISRLFAEMQASSLTPQDTDGLDSTEPEAVLAITPDLASPVSSTKALLVNRPVVGSGDLTEGNDYVLGASRTEARERAITRSKQITFRKVIGYQFKQTSGTIVPEWSAWITFRVNRRHQLIRTVPGRAPRVMATHVDALDAEARPDGTVLVTVITARRDPNGAGWKRYANSVTIRPKN